MSEISNKKNALVRGGEVGAGVRRDSPNNSRDQHPKSEIRDARALSKVAQGSLCRGAPSSVPHEA